VKYRVRCDLMFESEADARELWEAIKSKAPVAVSINAGSPSEERSRGNIHRYYHDEKPPKPCEVIEEFAK